MGGEAVLQSQPYGVPIAGTSLESSCLTWGRQRKWSSLTACWAGMFLAVIVTAARLPITVRERGLGRYSRSSAMTLNQESLANRKRCGWMLCWTRVVGSLGGRTGTQILGLPFMTRACLVFHLMAAVSHQLHLLG